MSDQTEREQHPHHDPLMYAHPPGFRARRGRNWFFLGLTYASYYLCRYNLGIVAPELKATLGFSNTQYGAIESARNGAYAVGQFINGLFTDRLGGKQAMTIGAIGTVILNLSFGIAAWSDISLLFFVLLIIRLADGYVQAFGAPGMVKINTSWFRRQERGTFAGIFGIMINLGQMGVGQLAPLLATGFSVPLLFYTLKVPSLDWRYMFIIPPVMVTIIVVLMNLMVKNHPEEAGYTILHDDEKPGEDFSERVHLSDVFRKITANPVVWIVAGAYFCTGFVRAAIYAWWVMYMLEIWAVDKEHTIFWWMAVLALPMLASAGSLGSGIVSDKLFAGRRAPVAALLYLAQVAFIVLAMAMTWGWVHVTATIAALTILGIHTGCNATHSLLGTAAAMDLGGRKMAGFAAGVIDSFQYFGAMLAGVGLGYLLDTFGEHYLKEDGTQGVRFEPNVWFLSMLPWALLGTGLMTYLWLRHRGSDEKGT